MANWEAQTDDKTSKQSTWICFLPYNRGCPRIWTLCGGHNLPYDFWEGGGSQRKMESFTTNIEMESSCFATMRWDGWELRRKFSWKIDIFILIFNLYVNLPNVDVKVAIALRVPPSHFLSKIENLMKIIKCPIDRSTFWETTFEVWQLLNFGHGYFDPYAHELCLRKSNKNEVWRIELRNGLMEPPPLSAAHGGKVM